VRPEGLGKFKNSPHRVLSISIYGNNAHNNINNNIFIIHSNWFYRSVTTICIDLSSI
jgi:hypothetical protein